jgi:hypothetical protein
MRKVQGNATGSLPAFVPQVRDYGAARDCVRMTALLNAVNLDQADAGGVVFATHDRGPVALDQRGENGGLTIVGGGKTRRLNCCLLRILPIIVRIKKISIAIVQLHLWIQQCISNPKAC